LGGSRQSPHSSNPSSSTIMEKESSRLSWPWKKKSSNKAAAVTTSLASAGGVGGASPNLASLFQDNNQQVQTPPFVPPLPSLSLSAALVLSQTSSAMVLRWVIAIPQLCKPGARTTTILISSSRTCWDRPRSNTSNLNCDTCISACS
jgi:hypothetical protein